MRGGGAGRLQTEAVARGALLLAAEEAAYAAAAESVVRREARPDSRGDHSTP